MSSHRQGVSHKRHQDVKLLKPRGRERSFFFQKKKKKIEKPNKPHFVTCEYSRAVFTKLTERSDMLQSLPRAAASKKRFKPIVAAASSQNRGSPLVCLALLPLPPQVRRQLQMIQEYANYLHIENTPRKTKSMARTLYKGNRAGFSGPQTHFANLMV